MTYSFKMWLVVAMLFMLVMLPTAVYAHDDTTAIRFGSYLAGFTHPVLGLDHFLAMVCVGIVSAQIGGRAIWTVPMTFVLVMAVGGFLGVIDIGLSIVEVGIASSVLVLGAIIAAEKRIPVVIALIAVGLFAIFHGYAHGAEIPSVARPFVYALGFLTGTALIHILGVVIGDISGHYEKGKLLLRIAGGVISIVGILFLAGVL
jgi:urease accessory protein